MKLLKTRGGRKKLVKLQLILVQFILLILYIVIEVLGIRPQCPIYTTTKKSCLACGQTRLVEAILQLNIYQAFRWNPFMFISLILQPIAIIKSTKEFIDTGKVGRWAIKLVIVWLIIGIIFMIIRNTAMFNCLLPTQL